MPFRYLYLSSVHISSQKTYSHFWISWNKLFLGIISLKVFNNELCKLPAFPKRVQIRLRKNWERELRSGSARAPGTFYPQTMEEVADSSEQMPEQAGWAMVQSLTWTGRPSLTAAGLQKPSTRTSLPASLTRVIKSQHLPSQRASYSASSYWPSQVLEKCPL